MQALEFSTTIEQGIIKLPVHFSAFSNARVRIIVLVDVPYEDKEKLMRKEALLMAFNRIQSKKVFRTIENPVGWQKKMRDEWQ